MKIIAISDTHTKHNYVEIPLEGDVLVHAGDWTYRGKKDEMRRFLSWFEAQPFPHKVLIAGNHELTLDPSHPRRAEMLAIVAEHDITYLENSAAVLDGVKFYGSPYSPRFHDWAFQYERDDRAEDLWDEIPDDTDVLITHGPAQGILDVPLGRYDHLGCPYLAKRIVQVNPKVHICGHIHTGHGKMSYAGNNGGRYPKQTEHYNVSFLDEQYRPAYKVTEIDL